MPKQNALDWEAWAQEHPLVATTLPAQDNYVICKPEVIALARGGSSVQATRAELDAALAAEPVQCPTCRGGGRIAVGPWGRTPAKTTCALCQGKGTLARNVAEAFRVGVEMGRSSAYIGHYDQYDHGSLMFSGVDSPYEPDVEITGEVNGRRGF